MACVQGCPLSCIEVKEDKEGFFYPKVDKKRCVDCGKCEKLCAELHPEKARRPLRVFAAKNPNEEIRLHSSSGGIFTLLAENIIEKGGVVFGARFDESWNVVHDYTETKDGLKAFRGSKYLQSQIGRTFIQTKIFLEAGREVMYTGTPCQIAGLRRFLQKDYDNLLTVDFVCHGVPSPKVWQIYLDETVRSERTAKKRLRCFPQGQDAVCQSATSIKSIEFRNKSLGWKNFSFALAHLNVTTAGEEMVHCSHVFHENLFMKAFLSNLILRPSCYHCPAKGGRSGSDITLGDYWGIENVRPDFDDDQGCSLVMLNNEKAVSFFLVSGAIYEETEYEEALVENACIEQSAKIPPYRNFFMHQCRKHQSLKQALDDRYSAKPIKRALRLLWKTVE